MASSIGSRLANVFPYLLLGMLLVTTSILCAAQVRGDRLAIIHLGVGFDKETVTVSVNDRVIFKGEISTDPSLGLAKGLTFKRLQIISHVSIKCEKLGLARSFTVDWRKGCIFEIDLEGKSVSTYQYKEYPMLD
jgi:hypothetical protein